MKIIIVRVIFVFFTSIYYFKEKNQGWKINKVNWKYFEKKFNYKEYCKAKS